jgi:two-component system, chemotaxis family, protein-glutamate methylesterase/glutaminase
MVPGGREQVVTKVLVVHDSVVAQRLLTRELSKAPDLEVAGTAVDPHIARERIAELAPDVVIVDLEMARMDGLSFVEALMTENPMPVVVVGSLSAEGADKALRALTLGAIEAVARPWSQFSAPAETGRLTSAVRIAAAARAHPPWRPVPPVQGAPALPTEDAVLCLGASTGGTRALEAIVAALPSSGPPSLIVQPLPGDLVAAFAIRLDSLCSMQVREARDGEPLLPGTALLAPRGRRTVVTRDGGRLAVRVTEAPSGDSRPGVDELFESVARHVGSAAMGVLLTGAGKDGALGLGALRSAGARTIAQDEATSVVWETPKAAIELGAVEHVLPLDQIAEAVIQWVAATPVAVK